MIPNRIETYCDLSQFAYLREYAAGWIQPAHENIAVVAEEIDGDGRTVRSWFLSLGDRGDGRCLPATVPPHTVVSTDIRPGEPTPPAVPIIQLSQKSLPNLDKLRAERVELVAKRERHTMYAKSHTEAVQRAIDLQATIDELKATNSAELKQRDDDIWELRNEVALNRLQIATLQASYAKLWEQKSLTERIKVWCRSMLKKLRAS